LCAPDPQQVVGVRAELAKYGADVWHVKLIIIGIARCTNASQGVNRPRHAKFHNGTVVSGKAKSADLSRLLSSVVRIMSKCLWRQCFFF